ncbi:bifunctional glycosyltransferase/CDP-glycerol:glycerophosphate glycerophosphotransferase [Brevibacterium album]|uniref:bifunctional glycosyltransferase/CDP-glycerol:glycerophosphate glycerophosphotransferase n=1 Tax=Brevibacterium album TaxID=417948 RepID=UPI000A0071B4|nr:CDP-glycerol glycerophosphotransferase family protein [Brevibacterium album]
MRRRLLTKTMRAAAPLLSRIPLKVRKGARERVDPTIAWGVARSLASRGRAGEGPLVTVVVPVYNVQAYLPRFLASLAAQTYRNLEILIIDDGSPDRSAQIARAWALLDPRIRVVSRENGGLGAARNTGAEEARGEYITFADSDDELAPDAISAMLSTLRRTGSDFVVGTIVRLQGNRKWIPHWARSAHRETRRSITLAEHPQMMLDVFACNKLWRTSFFREVVGGFPTGIAYEDQEPSLKSYLGASAFDVIPDQVYYWRVRDDGSSLSQQKTKLRDLEDRLQVTQASARLILAHADRAVREEWFRKLLAYDFIQYAEQVPRTGPEYFEVLSRGLREILDLFDEVPWEAVPIYPRLAGRFAANGEYEDLLSVLNGKITRGTGYRLEQSGPTLLAVPGYAEEFRAALPERLYEIRPESLELVTRAERAQWLDGDRVTLEISAFCRSAFEDAPDEGGITLSIENTATGERRELSTERCLAPHLNEGSGSEWRDARGSVVRTTIDTRELIASDSGGGVLWRLLATVTVGGHAVTEIVKTRAGDAGAAVLGFSSFSAGVRTVLTHDDLDGLVLRSANPQVWAHTEEVDGRRLRLTAEALNGKHILKLVVSNRRSWQSFSVKPVGYDHCGRAEFDFELPQLPNQHRTADRHTWQIKAEFADGRSNQVASSSSTHEFDERSCAPAPLMLYANSHGYLRVIEHPFLFTCDGLELSPDGTVIRTTGVLRSSSPVEPSALSLSGAGVDIAPSEFEWEDAHGRYSAAFPLTRTDWYGRTTGLSHGGYTLRWTAPAVRGDGQAEVQWALVSDADANRFPLWRGGRFNLIRATRTRSGRALWLRFSAPSAPEELGLRSRRLMIDEALRQNARDGLAETVVFESYHGKQLADSVRALWETVREQHPHLQTYWSVASSAVSVPEGAVRIIQGTPEWLEAVHRSRYLVNNANFPGYTRLQDGQRYIQTWHGTPMKRIAEDMPPENLSLGYRLLMRREVARWEFLLAQNPFSEEVLPAAFRYSGRTLALGYPRNDVLRSPDSASTRAAVRHRLGIDEDAPVVLYAPTFRDSKRTAGGFVFDTALDFSELTSMLPEGAAVLVRGHANTVPPDLAPHAGSIIDVGTYGEISELFLAADVLVTDYSSLLFDFAVTGKPMIFFVPDLEEYESSTRGFYLDFREICPGPMTRTTAETGSLVLRALADPGSFRDKRYEEFVERFAPWDDGHASARVLCELETAGWFGAEADAAVVSRESGSSSSASAAGERR